MNKLVLKVGKFYSREIKVHFIIAQYIFAKDKLVFESKEQF